MHNTRQELFDNALLGIRNQNGFGYDPDQGVCVYLSPEGCKCAIGHSIPDDLYDATSMERQTINNSAVVRNAAGVSDTDRQFAAELQRVHDNAAMDPDNVTDHNDFETNMERVAKEYNLKWTPKA